MKIYKFLLTGMILVVAAQSQMVKEQASMEAKIENQRYCRVNNKTGSLIMKFSVAMKNGTSATIALPKPIYVVPLVARTLQDLQNRKYEFTLYGPDVIVAPIPRNKVPEAEIASRQTIVKPREVFTGETMETAFPIPLTAKFSKRDALAPGSHFVQLVLDSETPGTEPFVRITSQPIEITVEKHPKVERCR